MVKKKVDWSDKEQVKAHLKEYYQRPEVKARIKEYRERPEFKAKAKEYYNRPYVKAKAKEYGQKRDKFSKLPISIKRKLIAQKYEKQQQKSR